MIRRIELNNFMSHAHTVIEPAAGLTVLIGPNNCGKSAVVAALQILCHNDNSTYVTRHGERECSVKVVTDDEHVIEWCRRNGSPRYTIDGKDFDRLGRSGLPDELHQTLRLPLVSSDANQVFDVHFGEQKSPIFLLDKPSTHAAQFFASSSDAIKLVEMQARHRQKVVEARRKQTELEAESGRLDKALSALEPLTAISERVQQIEEEHEALTKLGQRIVEATEAETVLRKALDSMSRHSVRAKMLALLEAPPRLEDTQPLDRVIGLVDGLQLASRRQSARVGALASLAAPPKLAETRPLELLIEQIQALKAAHEKAKTDLVALHELAVPPAMHDVVVLEKLVDRIGHSHHVVARLEADGDAMMALQPAPKLLDVQPLTNLLRDLHITHRQRRHSDHEIATLGDLSEPPVMSDVIAMFRMVAGLDKAKRAAERCDAVHGRLEQLRVMPEAVDYAGLEQVITQVDKLAGKVAEQSDAIRQINLERDEARDALRQWATDHRICPTCGGNLDPNRVVAITGVEMEGRTHG